MINIWGLILTIIVFAISKRLKQLKFLNKLPPTFMAGVILVAILLSFKLDYKSYNDSACFLTILLGPATIALAYPLVENSDLLTKNKRAVYAGFIVATITALLVNYLLGKIFHTDWNIVTSLMPKSVTTPIALEISKSIGGIPELTACIVSLTGIYGALFAHKILKIFHIKSDVAIGLAIGAASHVLGTSSCIEKKRQRQVVMATLALIIIGIMTTVACLIIFK